MATRQRVACILNYQSDLPDEDRWNLDIKRAQVDDQWETVIFDIPPYEEMHDYNKPPVRRPKIYLEKD